MQTAGVDFKLCKIKKCTKKKTGLGQEYSSYSLNTIHNLLYRKKILFLLGVLFFQTNI